MLLRDGRRTRRRRPLQPLPPVAVMTGQLDSERDLNDNHKEEDPRT
jgi:hypothetical protein